MKNPITTENVYDGHNSLLLKSGETHCKIVLFRTIPHHRESQFHLQGTTVPCRT